MTKRHSKQIKTLIANKASYHFPVEDVRMFQINYIDMP